MRTIAVVFLFVAVTLQAQVSDDFSDGNFIRAPKWSGDTSKFRVWDQRLQLFASPQSGQASLVVANRVINSAQWVFDLELGFNPSSSNLTRFYLVSDTSDLSASVHGYYVQIGSTADDVSLYRHDGSVRKILIDGADGRVNLSVVRIRVMVETDEDGVWKLQTDAGITGQWTTEGSIQDLTYTENQFSGWYCLYTSTRYDKFFLDNVFTSGSVFPDRITPKITGTVLPDSASLIIRFSEAMNAASVSNRNLYLPKPTSIDLLNASEVRLRLSPTLTDGQIFSQSIVGLQDLAGNILRDTVLSLPWVIPRVFSYRSVIIHEIMADPLPPVELPEAEYVELYNRSSHPFNMAGWQLTDGTTTALLPVAILMPGEWLAIWPAGTTTTLPGVQTSRFPSLNNSGDRLKLLDPDGRVIDSVSYSSAWHTVSGKSEGGWSLELIDPRNACHDPDNWASSSDLSGGTPGRENSVHASKPDVTGPGILNATATDSSGVLLTLSESVLPQSLLTTRFDFHPELNLSSVCLEADRKSLMLRFTDTLKTGMFYSAVVNGLRDCPGNFMPEDASPVRFLRPHQPDSLDVVINEIMFDPFPGEGDYLEIWNRTPKYFQMNGWKLARAVGDSHYGQQLIGSFLLEPNQYAVLTEDREMMTGAWPVLPDSLITVVSMPTLPDDEGGIALQDRTGRSLDVFHYERQFHSPLVKNEEGVALERLDPWSATDDPANWRSAAGVRGTPGYRNSCRVDSAAVRSTIWVDPPVASGSDDFIRLMYRFDADGWFTHARVFDLTGNEVRTLANGESLATSGFLRWDLDDDSGRRVWPGVYLAVVETYRTDGLRRMYRRRMVVTR